jgi:hypothetical protein
VIKTFSPKCFFSGCPIILFGTFLFISCSGVSGNVSAPGNPDSPGVKFGSETAVGSANASFSCKLDGVEFSSDKGTDNLNAAFRLKAGGKHIFFMLCDPDNPVQKLNFEIPGQTGSTTLTITPKWVYGGYTNPNWVSYNDDGLTVTISSISADRVSGSFSGQYKAPAGASTVKQEVQVTEGKFDIPFSQSASWKKTYQAE